MCTTLPGASAEKCCTAGYGGSPELWSDQGKRDVFFVSTSGGDKATGQKLRPPTNPQMLVIFGINHSVLDTPQKLTHAHKDHKVIARMHKLFISIWAMDWFWLHLPDVLATHVEVPARREAGLSVGWVSLLIFAEVIWAMPHTLWPARSGKIPSRRTGGSLVFGGTIFLFLSFPISVSGTMIHNDSLAWNLTPPVLLYEFA